MAVSWRARVDWNLDGDFTDTYDNITAFVRNTSRATRGFRDDLAAIADIGTLNLTLDNSDQRFTPDYASGPLYGYLRPMRPIVLEASPDGFVTTTWSLWRGYIKRFRPQAGSTGAALCYVDCEDMLSIFQRHRFAQPLQENRDADDLYGLIGAAVFRGRAATGTITPNGGAQPNNGDTVTIGEKTYQFVGSPTAAYEVLKGETAADSYANLTAAINNGEVASSGNGDGTVYGSNTFKSNEVSAEVSGTTITLTALYRGTLGNSIGLSTSASARITVSDSTLTGGTNGGWGGTAATATIAPDMSTETPPVDGDTVTIGVTTYRFKDTLAAAYDVLIDPSADPVTKIANTMHNLEKAINDSGVEGTNYGTYTAAHPDVTALYEQMSGQEVVNWVIVTARYFGTWGNDIPTSDTAGTRIVSGAFSGGADGPTYFSHEAGKRTYTIAGDRWSLDRTNAMTALMDVALSEYGLVWIDGSGILTTKSYHWEQQQAGAAAAMTLNNTPSDVGAAVDDDRIFNRVTVVNTPRRETTGAVIARAAGVIAVPGKTTDMRWNQTKGLSGAAAFNALPPGTKVMRLPYTDSGTGQVIGAKDIITPVRGTDFSLYDNPDGTGFNYTTNPHVRVTCSVAATGSGIEVTFSNTALATLYVFDFQVRGTRIEQFEPEESIRENTYSILEFGEHALPTYDLPLDAGDNFPDALANHLIGRYQQPVTRIDPIYVDDALMFEYWSYLRALVQPMGYWRLNEAVGSTIAADSSGNTGRDGAISGVTLGATGIGDGYTAASFDGVNDVVNVYTTGLRDAFNGAAGTLLIWAKANAAAWTDGVEEDAIALSVDDNNIVRIYISPANTLVWQYGAGGTSEFVAKVTTTTDWMCLALTWDKNAGASGEVKAFFNGVQEGATQVTLGTWVGDLVAGRSAIGAFASAGTSPWDGVLAHAALWDVALTAEQIAQFANAGLSYLDLDIGSRLDLTETQTSTSGKKLVVRGLDYELDAGGAVASMAIRVKSLSDSTYWILNDPVYSVLGSTTRLGL